MLRNCLVTASVCCVFYASLICIESHEISIGERPRIADYHGESLEPFRHSKHPLEEHIRSIQKSFDADASGFFREEIFIARVLNIRELNPGDRLVGQFRDDNKEVVILRILSSGREKGTSFKAGSTIAYPIGEMRSCWENYLEQEVGTLFVSFEFGESIMISKFGC